MGIRDLGVSDRRISDELATRLRREISAFVADPDDFRKRRGREVPKMIRDISVQTGLVILPDGMIEHQHQYEFPTDDALLGLCLAYLCDPRFPRDGLRQCKLDSCGRFFFKAGKRLFCPDRDCAEIYDNEQAVLVRVPRNRMKAALYARYSTDQQREASIDDQFRESEKVAERNGFTVVARFSDAAISGGMADRPGYQAMLSAARAGKFHVIVVEDISRLWRNRAEFGPRSAELEDLGVHMVTAVGDDTRRDGWALVVQIKQAMAEHYRREASYRTRRGLEGRAIKKAPTGGRSYGYLSAAESGTDQREVHPEQADVVRRIFRLYADGMSARAIADTLNRERVPSPGSQWKRSERRSGGWLASAIAGDARRGLGILNNELYCGRVIWNRFRWQRGAADSSKRRMVENPRSAWIVHEDVWLRIVPDDLWQAVRQRQQARSDVIGERVRKGLSRASAKSTGRTARYLLSGLLRCGSCGSSLIVSGGQYYACSTRVNGGWSACGNDARIALKVIEPLLLDDLKQSLRDPLVIAEARRRLRKRLHARTKAPKVTEAQVHQAEREVANLADAIASGVLRVSPALAARLSQAEDELARLQLERSRPDATPNVERLIAGLDSRIERVIADFERVLLNVDAERGRQELRQLLGQFKVEADAKEIRIYNEQGRTEAALARAIGADARNCGSGGVLPIQAIPLTRCFLEINKAAGGSRPVRSPARHA